MNPEEKVKLKKQYEELADSQLIQMLSDGADAYVEGAYELLLAEANNRKLQLENHSAEQDISTPEASFASEPEPEVNTYVQIVIVNHESDRAFLDSVLSQTDIPYYFQNLNIRRDLVLPVGLMVN